jgi:hypothetical protein
LYAQPLPQSVDSASTCSATANNKTRSTSTLGQNTRKVLQEGFTYTDAVRICTNVPNLTGSALALKDGVYGADQASLCDRIYSFNEGNFVGHCDGTANTGGCFESRQEKG